MAFNLFDFLLQQPCPLSVVGTLLFCMVASNRSQKFEGDKARRKSPEQEEPEHSFGQGDEKSNKVVALIEEEFINLGLWKINESVRRMAARTIAGEMAPESITTGDNKAEVKDLVTLYQEIKLDEFLKVDYNLEYKLK